MILKLFRGRIYYVIEFFVVILFMCLMVEIIVDKGLIVFVMLFELCVKVIVYVVIIIRILKMFFIFVKLWFLL